MAAVSDFTGYAASMLVLLTFMTKDMLLLRVVAILSNLAFISYGALAWLPPVLGLHLLLLPLNVIRLREFIITQSAHRSGDSESSAVGAIISALPRRSERSGPPVGRLVLARPNCATRRGLSRVSQSGTLHQRAHFRWTCPPLDLRLHRPTANAAKERCLLPPDRVPA
jgi:hypothetical protein